MGVGNASDMYSQGDTYRSPSCKWIDLKCS